MRRFVNIHSLLPAATSFAGALSCWQEPGNAYRSDTDPALARRCVR